LFENIFGGGAGDLAWVFPASQYLPVAAPESRFIESVAR
jgi:hypothetical protein